MSGGWVKIWRAAIEHPCLHDFDELGVWTQLLMRAARQPTTVRYRKRVIKLETGQVALSVRAWARDGRIGHKRLRLILSSFSEHEMILAKTGAEMGSGRGTDFTLITVCNYEKYQSADDPKGHSLGNGSGHSRGTVRAQLGHTEQEGEKVEKVEKSSPPIVPLSNPDAFDEFWFAYPAKIGKGQARRAWNAAVKKTDPAEIIAGLHQAIRNGAFNRNPKYIPHPATWLNGERWADQPAQSVTPKWEPWHSI